MKMCFIPYKPEFSLKEECLVFSKLMLTCNVISALVKTGTPLINVLQMLCICILKVTIYRITGVLLLVSWFCFLNIVKIKPTSGNLTVFAGCKAMKWDETTVCHWFICSRPSKWLLLRNIFYLGIFWECFKVWRVSPYMSCLPHSWMEEDASFFLSLKQEYVTLTEQR